MLQKSKKLKREDFKKMRGSKTLSSPCFLIRFQTVSNPNPAKFAVIAPKSVYKLAVQRNRARRQVYSYLKSARVSSKASLVTVTIRKPIPESFEGELQDLLGRI